MTTFKSSRLKTAPKGQSSFVYKLMFKEFFTKYRKIIYATIAVILLIAGLNIIFGKKTNISSNSKTLNSKVPKASVKIDKSFDFKASNIKKEKKPITFTITSVDKKDEIKVKGNSRKANEGREFLLVKIELNNKLTERLAFTSSDFIRLEVNGKLYAPDYHNGGIILEPLSIKNDLVAFIVNSSVKQFSFLVGELDSEKQKVEVQF